MQIDALIEICHEWTVWWDIILSLLWRKLVDGEIERLRKQHGEFSKLNEFLSIQGSHEATNNNITFYDLQEDRRFRMKH